jgi:hypothetical protein
VRCLRCQEKQHLVVAIDEGSTSHTRHWTDVYRCDTCDEGEIRGFSHDSWSHHEDEEWDMTWSARLASADLDVLSGALLDCPDPAVPACECAAHVSLRKSTRSIGPSRIDGDEAVGPDERTWRTVTVTDDGLPEVVEP